MEEKSLKAIEPKIMDIVYKVVKVTDGKRVSAVLHHNSKFLTEYGENITTIPPIGKLFAFDSIKNARSFSKDWGADSSKLFEIWKASGENASKPKHIKWVSFSTSGQHIMKFWEVFTPFHKGPSRHWIFEPAPKGALICDSIKLIKLVEVVD